MLDFWTNPSSGVAAMAQEIPWNALGTAGALILGVVNLALIFWRIDREAELRKAELAMRMVEAEYQRRDEWRNIPTFEVFAFMLPIVREVYRKGEFADLEPHLERLRKRLQQVMQARGGTGKLQS